MNDIENLKLEKKALLEKVVKLEARIQTMEKDSCIHEANTVTKNLCGILKY